MKGEISYVNPKGFFFISVKDSDGFLTKFFGLRSRIIRGAENLAVGAICDFKIAQPNPKSHGSCQEAEAIDIFSPLGSVGKVQPSLDNSPLVSSAKAGE